VEKVVRVVGRVAALSGGTPGSRAKPPHSTQSSGSQAARPETAGPPTADIQSDEPPLSAFSCEMENTREKVGFFAADERAWTEIGAQLPCRRHMSWMGGAACDLEKRC
jgi:hypothetical protein